MRLKRALPILLLPLALAAQEARVRTGAEILLESRLELLRGLRVGVLCNHTAILPNRTHLVDTLRARGIHVVALFSPEHGIRGTKPAGASVGDTTDEQTGLPVYSIYRVPTERISTLFKSIDLLIIDLQDVGVRFYTYYITLSYALEAAAQCGLRCVLLDRPNPINGTDVEGPLLDPSLQSDVGRFPLPVRHGLTLGELARMMVGERWIPAERLSLDIIPMEGWSRNMWFDDTKLPWMPPSPNMKSLSTAVVYPGTCLFEATNVSEGRGSAKPFEYVGAPWIGGKKLASRLNSAKLPGIRFHPTQFTPVRDPVRSPNPKYAGQLCSGVSLEVIDRQTFRPVLTALKMLSVLHQLYPYRLELRSAGFDRLAGSPRIRQALEESLSPDVLSDEWNPQIEQFRAQRQRYLLY